MIALQVFELDKGFVPASVVDGPESHPGQPKQLSFLLPARCFAILIVLRLIQQDRVHSYTPFPEPKLDASQQYRRIDCGPLAWRWRQTEVTRSQRTARIFSVAGTTSGEAVPGSLGPLVLDCQSTKPELILQVRATEDGKHAQSDGSAPSDSICESKMMASLGSLARVLTIRFTGASCQT